MATEHELAMAKRAREAQRRVLRRMEHSGERALADCVVAKIDDINVKQAASGEKRPVDEHRVITDMGGFPIDNSELHMYGIDPAVLYVLNDEEATEPMGKFYGFDDGSIIMVKFE